MDEIEKYKIIYQSGLPQWGRYGHSNHGQHAIHLLAGVRSLIDVGCGHNQFAQACKGRGIRAIGVDFACPSADIVGPAHRLPFRAGRFDMVTAFDMLEHLRPDDVATVLREFARVSRRYIFSISYRPSRHTVHGETLHPCVRPEAWWVARIAEAGGRTERAGRYLTGEWSHPLTWGDQ